MSKYLNSIIRILFGIIWLIDSYFKWQTPFLTGFSSYIASNNQLPILKLWYEFWSNIININPSLFAYSVATLETLTALGLIFGFAKKIGYVIASILALLIWGVAEGFGGPYSASSTDIGTGIIYFLVFVCLYYISTISTDYLSIDYILSKRITFWKKIS